MRVDDTGLRPFKPGDRKSPRPSSEGSLGIAGGVDGLRRTLEARPRNCTGNIRLQGGVGIPVKTEVEDPSAQSNRKERELALDRAVARFEPILQFAHVRGKKNELRLCEPASGAMKPGLVRAAMRPSVKCC